MILVDEKKLGNALKACLSDSEFPLERRQAVLRAIRKEEKVVKKKISAALVFAIVLTLVVGGAALAANLGVFGQSVNDQQNEQSVGRLEKLENASAKFHVSRLEAIQTQARYISYISPSVNSSGQAIFGANNTPTTVYGISPEYLDIRRYKVEEGDIFSEQDVKTAAKVCLVGKSVVDELFPDGESPVGKVIRFGKIPLRIVGVLESKGYNSMGMDQDDLILAPYTTVQKRILAITHLQSITCSALSEEYTDQAIEEITQILRTNHKLKATDEDDFTIRSQQELSSMLTSTTDMMTLLLAAVAGISLLVGGIGIMNIMYVSVTERTREIGLRMSIGAKGRDILAQFLIESILISVTGGVIGILVGVGAAVLVNIFAAFPIYIQPWSVFLSFAVCTLTGIFFGWYPAQKAAMLNPIDALRYE